MNGNRVDGKEHFTLKLHQDPGDRRTRGRGDDTSLFERAWLDGYIWMPEVVSRSSLVACLRRVTAVPREAMEEPKYLIARRCESEEGNISWSYHCVFVACTTHTMADFIITTASPGDRARVSTKEPL